MKRHGSIAAFHGAKDFNVIYRLRVLLIQFFFFSRMKTSTFILTSFHYAANENLSRYGLFKVKSEKFSKRLVGLKFHHKRAPWVKYVCHGYVYRTVDVSWRLGKDDEGEMQFHSSLRIRLKGRKALEGGETLSTLMRKSWIARRVKRFPFCQILGENHACGSCTAR